MGEIPTHQGLGPVTIILFKWAVSKNALWVLVVVCFFFFLFEVCLTRKSGFGMQCMICYFAFVYVTL